MDRPSKSLSMASKPEGPAPLSKILFKAGTSYAYPFKVLIDTLNFYLKKKGCFVINSKGISLCNTNEKEDVLCDINLPSENFQEYVCKQESICFSVAMNVFYNDMLKGFKKKDYICIQILDESGKLFLKIIKDNPSSRGNNQIANKIPITESKHVPIDPPTGYGRPVTVLSGAFTASCRGITRPTSKQMTITCFNDTMLKLNAKKDDIVENEVTLGTLEDETAEPITTFQCKCSAAYVVRLAKLAASSDMVKIFTKQDLPVHYKMNLASLGEVNIYIKTSEQVQSEHDSEHHVDDED
jgi:Proliferating cell nuclear antigen, N-terminal domain